MTKIAAGITRREKSAQVSGLGGTLAKISHVGWGNAGHDPVTGEPIVPTGNEIEAYGEFLRNPVDSVSVNLNKVTIIVSLKKDEGNGQSVSSCALYDEEGDIVAIANFTPKPKTEDDIFETTWIEEH